MKAIRIPESELDEWLERNNIDLRTVEDLQLIIEVPVEGELFPVEKTLGLGPFTLKTRQELLNRLLETQERIRKEYGVEVELIGEEEIQEIHRIWEAEKAKSPTA